MNQSSQDRLIDRIRLIKQNEKTIVVEEKMEKNGTKIKETSKIEKNRKFVMLDLLPNEDDDDDSLIAVQMK